MRNLRTCLLSDKDLAGFDVADIVGIMKRHGFSFERAECPVKLRKPWTATRDDSTGIVTWTQWENDA